MSTTLWNGSTGWTANKSRRILSLPPAVSINRPLTRHSRRGFFSIRERLCRSVRISNTTPSGQQGWDKLGNGELLAAAEEAGFELLPTTDKNMRYQQNL